MGPSQSPWAFHLLTGFLPPLLLLALPLLLRIPPGSPASSLSAFLVPPPLELWGHRTPESETEDEAHFQTRELNFKSLPVNTVSSLEGILTSLLKPYNLLEFKILFLHSHQYLGLC